MTDHELLIALSDLMDTKLSAFKTEISKELEHGLNQIHLIFENEIRPNIKLLAENYIPAANKFEEASEQIELLKTEVELLQSVVTEHSSILQQIS